MNTRGWFPLKVFLIVILLQPIIIPIHLNPLASPAKVPVSFIADNSFELMWTSRWQPSFVPVMNNTEITGDHVVLNATFPEYWNITKCLITIENGFKINTTRELVIPLDPGGQFDGVINHTEFDWVIVKGFEKGLNVNLICNFTNGDSDFMAWTGDQEYSLFTYSNNILNMASGSKPETDVFLWESDNDTLYIGCLNYDQSPGNWTLNLQVGVCKQIGFEGNSVIYDTYTLDRRNQTVNIRVEGTTESNDTLTFYYTDVKLGNFFTPYVIVFDPIEIEPDLFNITWTCEDKNANDTNYFSVWLSGDGGVSYQVLARNLTRTYYVWDSSGFLERDDYIFRIRAFSVDLVSGLASVDDEASYWPGDFSDGFSSSFAHDGPFYVPVYLVNVDEPPDIFYFYGDEGNSIIWELDVQTIYRDFVLAFSPANFHYTILRDNEVIFSASWGGENHIEVNVDHLDVGVYNYTLSYWSPAEGMTKYDWVIVTVRERPSFAALIIAGGTGGVCVGLLVLFRMKKNLSQEK